MESNSSRPVSEILHHAIANGDITTLQSLLKQGVNADSRLYIDEEILETASRKSLASVNSYRTHSYMETSSVRESIMEEEPQNLSDDKGEQLFTTDVMQNDFKNVEEQVDDLDKIMRDCQQEVADMQLDVTVIEVKMDTEDNESTSDNDDLNVDVENSKLEVEKSKLDDYLELPTEKQTSDLNESHSPQGESAKNYHEHDPVITKDSIEDTSESQTRDTVAVSEPQTHPDNTETVDDNDNNKDEEEYVKLDKNNTVEAPTEGSYLLFKRENDTTNNNTTRKSMADTIDARLHDENESLIERAASVRVKEESNTERDQNETEEKPLKLIPRIKRRLSQKWKKPKPKEQLDEEDEEDELAYQNIIRPPNVDDEQLNENFEGVAFFEAVREGMDMIVQTLLETSNNYQLNMLDENGFTPIMQAAWHGQTECLHILLDHGAQTDLQNATGCTAAHFAAGQGHTDCLKLLISFDNDVVDMKTKYGATPLLLAAKGGFTECVEALLSAGADPNTQYRGNQNAMLFAAGNGHYECLQELLKHEVRVDQPNSQQVTPLMRAIQQGHNACVTLLLENGAGINLQDAIGRAAVHFAVEYNNPKALKLLLQNGASVELKTKGESKPLDYAERFQNTKCAEIIENHLNKIKEEREKERELEANIQKQQEKTNNVSCLSFKHLFRKKKSVKKANKNN